MRANTAAAAACSDHQSARRDTLAACYSDYSGEVRAHIACRLPRAQDIDDLVQEVFLRVHRAFVNRRVEHPRAYIYQVANSVICDYFRQGQRRGTLPGDIEEVDESRTAHVAPTPEEVAIGEETWEILCASIDRLPNKVREAIMLRKFEDLSYREVANSMGISVRTVEKHLARALRDIRSDYDGELRNV